MPKTETEVSFTIKADITGAIAALDDARRALCRFVGVADDTPLNYIPQEVGWPAKVRVDVVTGSVVAEEPGRPSVPDLMAALESSLERAPEDRAHLEPS